MVLTRWITGCVLILMAASIVAFNTRVALGQFRSQGTQSWLPVIGGVSGAIGLYVMPNRSVSTLWWLPLFLDWGTIPGLTYAVVWHALRLYRRR